MRQILKSKQVLGWCTVVFDWNNVPARRGSYPDETNVVARLLEIESWNLQVTPGDRRALKSLKLFFMIFIAHDAFDLAVGYQSYKLSSGWTGSSSGYMLHLEAADFVRCRSTCVFMPAGSSTSLPSTISSGTMAWTWKTFNISPSWFSLFSFCSRFYLKQLPGYRIPRDPSSLFVAHDAGWITIVESAEGASSSDLFFHPDPAVFPSPGKEERHVTRVIPPSHGILISDQMTTYPFRLSIYRVGNGRWKTLFWSACGPLTAYFHLPLPTR